MLDPNNSVAKFTDDIEVHLTEIEMFIQDLQSIVADIREETKDFVVKEERRILLEGLENE